MHGVDGRERRAMRARRGMAPRRHRHSQHSEEKAKKAIRRRLLIGCRARDIFLDSQTLDPHARIADRPKSFKPRSDPRAAADTNGIFLLRQAPRRSSLCSSFTVCRVAKRRVSTSAVTRSGGTSPPTETEELARTPRGDSTLSPACLERRPFFLRRSAQRARCGPDKTVIVTIARILAR